MRRNAIALLVATIALLVLAEAPYVGSQGQQLTCSACASGVVDKRAGGGFTVEITFKNAGTAGGTWSVNVAFEGEQWAWTGTAQTLILAAGSKKTLIWDGTVPATAPAESVARLVVYYDDAFVALNWWIHVVPSVELSISSSLVR